MSRGWVGGSTRQWRRVRAFVLARDAYLCQLRLPGCTVRAPLDGGHAHHTRGKAHGDDPRYIVAACESCNLAAGEPAPDPQPIPRTTW
jgi:5-methylcytosine-specific restriction endonuclease McrA